MGFFHGMFVGVTGDASRAAAMREALEREDWELVLDDISAFSVRRVEGAGGSSHIRPALDPSWDPLTRLRWNAAVSELDSGLRVRVIPTRGLLRRYRVQYGSAVTPGMDYRAAWSFISNIR